MEIVAQAQSFRRRKNEREREREDRSGPRFHFAILILLLHRGTVSSSFFVELSEDGMSPLFQSVPFPLLPRPQRCTKLQGRGISSQSLFSSGHEACGMRARRSLAFTFFLRRTRTFRSGSDSPVHSLSSFLPCSRM